METKTKQPTDEESNRKNILLERASKRLNSRCKGLLEAQGSDAISESPKKFFMKGLQLFDNDTGYTTSSALSHSRAAGIRNYFVVTYLHRTVRDYLEQPAVWNDVLLETKHTGFDADAALLMSYAIDVKFSDWFMDKSMYEAAKANFERVARLITIASECHVPLIEELDRTFAIRWRDHGYLTSACHWSNGNPKSSHWEHPTEKGIEWQSDILCMVIVCRINWYLDARIPPFFSQSAPTGRPGLPLLRPPPQSRHH